ncbi:hypothetical protein HYC85_022644 [Camellia sinensis]|uniref:Uncharacterized protein n=1 Tax=Camellia sinensis TaxID=4442 RepID=A0A7J7GDJ2_CAMSI|nr:hypothetical protein HYC85_022644 [Camellia sinensis]
MGASMELTGLISVKENEKLFVDSFVCVNVVRWASSTRRGGMTVLGKVAVPKPFNLPSQRKFNKVVALKLLTTFEDIIGNKLELEKAADAVFSAEPWAVPWTAKTILQLSIWDLRMKENGGCVHRIYGSVGDIFYAVCSSSTSIAVGGADCTVTVYDPRRSCLVPRKSLRHTKRTFEFIPSAAELHEAGVKFKVSSSKSLFDIKFSGNVLEIPQKRIYDSTERLLRNIIAYEQCHCEVKFVTDYTVVLVYLINTSKDVELLVKAKLNDYYKIRSHKWKATLRHNYCNTPRKVLSIIVAAILLGLTFIQSLCSLLSFTIGKIMDNNKEEKECANLKPLLF